MSIRCYESGKTGTTHRTLGFHFPCNGIALHQFWKRESVSIFHPRNLSSYDSVVCGSVYDFPTSKRPVVPIEAYGGVGDFSVSMGPRTRHKGAGVWGAFPGALHGGRERPRTITGYRMPSKCIHAPTGKCERLGASVPNSMTANRKGVWTKSSRAECIFGPESTPKCHLPDIGWGSRFDFRGPDRIFLLSGGARRPLENWGVIKVFPNRRGSCGPVEEGGATRISGGPKGARAPLVYREGQRDPETSRAMRILRVRIGDNGRFLWGHRVHYLKNLLGLTIFRGANRGGLLATKRESFFDFPLTPNGVSFASRREVFFQFLFRFHGAKRGVAASTHWGSGFYFSGFLKKDMNFVTESAMSRRECWESFPDFP